MKAKKKKRTVGKPKRVFSDAQMEEMAELALIGCQSRTIARIMDISDDTLVSRPDIQALFKKKRAERKRDLRVEQNKAAGKGNPALLIFLGKNILDQTDKLDMKHGVDDESMGRLLEILDGRSRGLPK